MFAGLGIIGSLASILSSLLISPASTQVEGADDEPSASAQSVQQELVDIREELVALRRLVAGYERVYQRVLASGDGGSRVLGT